MRNKTYTVVAICTCGCDENEIHILKAKGPGFAAEHVNTQLARPKRVVAVFKGAHYEQRLEP